MKPPNKFFPHALHHSYIGVCLIFLGIMATGQTWSFELGWVLNAIGTYCIIDDVWEHTVTANTPLRILFEKAIFPLFKKR